MRTVTRIFANSAKHNNKLNIEYYITGVWRIGASRNTILEFTYLQSKRVTRPYLTIDVNITFSKSGDKTILIKQN